MEEFFFIYKVTSYVLLIVFIGPYSLRGSHVEITGSPFMLLCSWSINMNKKYFLSMKLFYPLISCYYFTDTFSDFLMSLQLAVTPNDLIV